MRALVVIPAAAALSGCTDWAGYDLDSYWGTIDVLSTMRTSVALDPYDLPRLPPEHSIPVASPMGDLPPEFTQVQLDSAAATLASPFAGQPPAEVLARGEVLYDRQCAVCHGQQGQGTGPVVGPGKYPFAPPINGAATSARSDGYIYGIITVGRGLMPPYGWALAHEDRWAVVAYVRRLQQQGGAPAAAPAPAPAGQQPAQAVRQ
jgi:mono/diheme cytochrome c family protein